MPRWTVTDEKPDRDDRPFRHYTLRHRIISWISRHLFDRLTYTIRRGPLKGMRRKGGLAWIPELGRPAGRTPEERFLAGLDVAGKVVYDVGAFEGLFTLFFARRARHVVCYEPNPRNHARLLKNLALNRIQNVTVRKAGLGAKPCSAKLVWDPAMAGAATVADTSMAASIASTPSARWEDIEVTTLDLELEDGRLPRPDFVKIDVEGYELPVLEGARRCLESTHPPLYLEMHGETMNEKRRNVRAVVDCITAMGYQVILHVESAQLIARENCERAAQGHLYATQ